MRSTLPNIVSLIEMTRTKELQDGANQPTPFVAGGNSIILLGQ